MTKGYKADVGIQISPNAYGNFQGLDTNRHFTAQDSGDKQFLLSCRNAHCDWQGQIIRNPSAAHIYGEGPIGHLRSLDEQDFVYTRIREGAVDLMSSRGHELLEAYFPGSVVSSTVFDGLVHVCSFGQPMRYYDGVVFRENPSASIKEEPPAYICSVNRRLAVAGLPSYPTRVWLSRVDQWDVFPPDEDPASSDVLRAGYIDIGNLLGSADRITGIGAFEWNRLVIFTAKSMVIYRLDPNIERWELEDQVASRNGCTAHGSIVPAGRDMLYASPEGVHAVSRSKYNNLSVYGRTLSDRIQLYYKALYSLVPDPQQICGVWDQQTSQYHLFMPVSDSTCYRLSMTLTESDEVAPKWNEANYLTARCGDTVGSRLLFGGDAGVFEAYSLGQDATFGEPVEMHVETPVLWCGSLMQEKQAHSYVLQASGAGKMLVTIKDENGVVIQSDDIVVEQAEDGIFGDISLAEQYERRFERRFRGVRFVFESTGTSLLRITGLAINVRR